MVTMRKSYPSTTGIFLVLALSLGGCANVNVSTPPQFAASVNAPYTLDSGDRLRIVVFGQNNLSASYTVDPAGIVTLPLIGGVEARGRTTFEMQKDIEARLRNGYLREPNVSAEIETYRPFFILGEVQTSGQYPFVAGMTAENAVAIANGFSPRAVQGSVEIARKVRGQEIRATVPLTTPLKPGDVVTVRERWF
jgi:polysaccharide biosynthesis/export protein